MPNINFRIYRPLNSVGLFFSLLYIAFHYSKNLDLLILLWSAGVGIIATAGYVQNYLDDEGKTTLFLKPFIWFAIGNMCLLAISLLTYQWLFISSGILAAFMLHYYSRFLKNRGVIGNITIALLSSWAFIGLALLLLINNNQLNLTPVLWLAFIGFTSTLSREFIKDIQDIEEDVSLKRHTLPLLIGVLNTAIINVIFVLITCIAMILISNSIGLWLLVIVYFITSLFFLKHTDKAKKYQLFIKAFQLVVILIWPFIS